MLPFNLCVCLVESVRCVFIQQENCICIQFIILCKMAVCLNPGRTISIPLSPLVISLSFSERALHEKRGRRLSRNFSAPLSCPSVSSWHYFSLFFPYFSFFFSTDACIWTSILNNLPLNSSSFDSLFICQFLQTTDLTSSNSLIPNHSFIADTILIVLRAKKTKQKKTCSDNLLSDCWCLIASVTSATSISLIWFWWAEQLEQLDSNCKY